MLKIDIFIRNTTKIFVFSRVIYESLCPIDALMAKTMFVIFDRLVFLYIQYI